MKTQNWNGFAVFSDNIPLKRAGIYIITNISSGRIYVGISGNVAHRVREHARRSGGNSKIGRAIAESGAHEFLATPIYYTLDDSGDGLSKIETQIIQDLDSIQTGYNILAISSKGGKRGYAFSLAVKAGHNTPEAIAKRLIQLADKDLAKRRGDAIRIAHARPEVKEVLRQRFRAPLSDQGLERLRAAQIINHAKPEIRVRKSEAMKANHQDAKFKERHLRGVRIANASPERNSKIAESRKGGIWLTNGTEDKFQRGDAPIPEGWRRGRTKNRKAA